MTLSFSDLDEMIQYLEQEAAEHALKVYESVLKHDAESIAVVENILARLHGHYLSTRSLDGIFGLSMFYGAYIGEVIRSHNILDAQWNGEATGRTFPSLAWSARHGGETIVFPIQWCYARIVQGPAENVWIKYETKILKDSVLVNLIERAKGSSDL